MIFKIIIAIIIINICLVFITFLEISIVTIPIIIFIIGMTLFFIFRENTVNDITLVKGFDMKFPSIDEYNLLIKSTNNVYIRSNYNKYKKSFFVSDYDGNLLYIIKREYGTNIYNITDPFYNVLGNINVDFISIRTCFEVAINGNDKFMFSRDSTLGSDYESRSINLYLSPNKENKGKNIHYQDEIIGITSSGGRIGNLDLDIRNINHGVLAVTLSVCIILRSEIMERNSM